MHTEHYSPSAERQSNGDPSKFSRSKKRVKRPIPETHKQPQPLQDLNHHPRLSDVELEQLARTGDLLREPGEDAESSLPPESTWSTETPADLQILLDKEGKLALPLEETVELPQEKPPQTERKIFVENPHTILPDLGFPAYLEPTYQEPETKEIKLHHAHELENQLLSFDQHIKKLQQEEQKTWLKGAIRKRLEQARQARDTIWNTHEDLLKEVRGDYQGLLQSIETQLAQQREEIVRLQTIYDKAWFKRDEKFQQLEKAKNIRTDLLKKRMEIRQKAGIIDHENTPTIKASPEYQQEKLLENIKTELRKKREQVLQFKSAYDKAWWPPERNTKRKQFEEAKKEFSLYSKKLKETYKE